MSNGLNGINKAIAIINAVVKKSTKVFVKALPLGTIVANVGIAIQGSPQDPAEVLRNLVRRYTGFDVATGNFSLQEAGMGAGTLLGSTLVSKALAMVA